MTYEWLIGYPPALIHFDLVEEALLNLVFHEFGHCSREDLGVNRTGRHIVDDVCLGQVYLYCSFYCSWPVVLWKVLVTDG